jgi:hypothetical protein
MIHRRASRRHSGRQRWPVLLLAVCCGSTGAFGEEREAEKSSGHPIFSDQSPVSANSVTADRPLKRSSSAGVSSRVTSMIMARLPAYTPAAHTDDGATPADVIKLPPLLVSAPKLRVPDEVQSLSRDEFAARLRKLYPGASVPGQDPYHVEHGMPNYARFQYENDRRNEQVAAVDSLADLLEHTGDRAGSRRLKKEIQKATIGGTYKDPLLDAMDKSANGGRR